MDKKQQVTQWLGAHGPNERSKLSDLVEAAKVYALTAMDFCQ